VIPTASIINTLRYEFPANGSFVRSGRMAEPRFLGSMIILARPRGCQADVDPTKTTRLERAAHTWPTSQAQADNESLCIA